MTLSEHLQDAMGQAPMTPDETAAAWFLLFEDMLDELAMAGRSQWEGAQ